METIKEQDDHPKSSLWSEPLRFRKQLTNSYNSTLNILPHFSKNTKKKKRKKVQELKHLLSDVFFHIFFLLGENRDEHNVQHENNQQADKLHMLCSFMLSSILDTWKKFFGIFL